LLSDKKIGFIGAGMMAEAIACGLLKAGVSADNLLAFDTDASRKKYFLKELGIRGAADSREVVGFAEIIILAVKPFIISEVLSEIGESLHVGQLLISIAAGITTSSIEDQIERPVPVVRVMPNTPCLIGEGATAVAPGKYAERRHLSIAEAIFGAVGKVATVTEDKIDAVTGLSGSGPAYVYMFIEALADGGVRMGLPRPTALLLAAQTVAGAARMVLETGEHPAALRDRVTTPGGTTIAATAALEASCFRSAAIEAVTIAAQKSVELGKNKK